jgi:hypothetical protein
LSDLPNYIADFSAMMKRHGQEAFIYAHAGALNAFASCFE